jgi:hypothetical protein
MAMGIQNITSPEAGIFLIECNRTTCQRRKKKKNSETANAKIL